MKRHLAGIAVAAVFSATLAAADSPPPQPGPEHAKLGIWVGDWTYETDMQASPLGPAGKCVGHSTTRPVLGGRFIEFRGEDTGPTGTTQWTETDGFDALNKCYRWTAFVGDGSVQDVTYQIDGTKVPYSGTLTAGGQRYLIRGTCVFTDDFTANTDHREISVDGREWQPLWVCRATKLKAALTLPSGNDSEQELIRLEEVWTEGLRKADAASIDRLLASEYRCTNDSGMITTKAQDLATLRSGDLKFTSLLSDDIQVRVYGDTAVVTGRNTERSTYKGADTSGQYRWTDTWVKRDGQWQCVATHYSKVAQK